VASLGAATLAPISAGTTALSGGTDGATTITSSILVGVDTIPRKGMYALRNTNTSVAMLADADDTTQWTYQVAFGLSEGVYMIGVSPAGDTITNIATSIATAGIDSYAMKIIFGDWCFIFDQVNNQTRLISPQGFIAGLLGNMTPSNSTLNKQLQGIIGTQKTSLNQQYSQAELQSLALARVDLITNPAPGGNYFASRFGRNTSSNAVIHGDNYPRLTNFIAATLNAGMGIYVGKKISPTLMRQAYATLDSFLFNLEQQGETAAHQIILNNSNNPFSRTALGYLQADVKVQYQDILEYFLVNLQGGQSVQIQRVATSPVS
jgi:phage tail sheath protein FI